MIYVTDHMVNGVVDGAAIKAALARVPKTGSRVIFPPGRFSVNETITIDTNNMTIEGECGPHPVPGIAATELVFPYGVPGMIITSHRCCLRGICLSSVKGTGQPPAAGITITGHAINLRDCGIVGFSGDGVAVLASATPGHPNINANLFYFEHTTFRLNGRHGLYVRGNNANQGCGWDVSFESNGGWGLLEEGTYGSAWRGHASNNALGPYCIDGASACSLLLGCYSESGQKGSWISARTISIGGLQAAGPDGSNGFDPGQRPGQIMGSVMGSATSGLQLPLLQELVLAGMARPTGGRPGDVIPINGKLLWVCDNPNRWRMRFVRTVGAALSVMGFISGMLWGKK